MKLATFSVLSFLRPQRYPQSPSDIGVMLSGGGPGPLTRCLRAASYSPRTQTACGKRASARCRQEPIAYAFQVDGVRVLDPVNTHTSESNTLVWSMFSVSGSPLMDTRDVPHGAVASVFYYSHVLKTTRRMHIYIPPGYEELIRTEKGDSS